MIASTTNLVSAMKKFYQIEETHSMIFKLTEEQEECEQIFILITTRAPNSSFFVNTPFKIDPKILGDSLTKAVKLFLYLKRRLQKDPILKEKYKMYQ